MCATDFCGANCACHEPARSNIQFVEAPPSRQPKKELALPDWELLDYLSDRVYVEATDQGSEDPNRFQNDMNFKGSFRQDLSEHIRKVRAQNAEIRRRSRNGGADQVSR